MSLTPIALGWDVKQAVVARRGGKLLLVGGGTNGFLWNTRVGYAGWGRTQNTVTYDEDVCRAAIPWLTGKATGANVLVLGPSTRPFAFGTFFETNIQRSPTASGSETYQETGGGTLGPWNYGGGVSATFTYATPTTMFGWTLTDWGGINPTSYDCVCFASYYRNTTVGNNSAGIDAYLANGGGVWAFQTTSRGWQDYGFDHSSYQSSSGYPDYLNTAQSVTELGGSLRYSVYSSLALVASSSGNVMGGTSVRYGNSFGLWYL